MVKIQLTQQLVVNEFADGAVVSDDEAARKAVGVGAFNDHPDPAVRLENWRNIARRHISAETCDRLARNGFPELAVELMRQRGDIE